MQAVPHAVRTLIGRDRPGVRLALAAEAPLPKEIVDAINAAFRLDSAEAAPDEDAARGRILCNCFDVAESEIDAFFAKSNSLAELQASLKCGTNCGSCLPELRRKVLAEAAA